jgi:hypothetical protein
MTVISSLSSGLPLHFPQRASALRARAIGVVQLVHLLNGRQLGLRPGAVPAVRRACRGRGRRLRPWALFRGGAEEGALALREQLLEEGEFALQREGRRAAEPGQLLGEIVQPGV